jgi:predicted amidophosphoribosyltransferase
MYRTIGGLAMVALTALAFYLVSRNRYKCPHCGRVVKWSDERCPHCGDDMKFQHRAGPPPKIAQPPFIARTSTSTKPPSRRRAQRGSGTPR